jgi:hypothetical protein
MSITRDDWLRALGEADCPVDDNALTVQELMALLDLTEASAARKAKRLVEDGKAERVRKRVENAAGQRITVPAYRLRQPT